MEWERCRRWPDFWIAKYVKIYDPKLKDWIKFDLWDIQKELMALLLKERLSVILKARQLGFTWLVLALILHASIFAPVATSLVFSRREEDARYLLGEERLRGMFRRLPEWMRPKVTRNDANTWGLANGSVVRCFPTNAGDSYTATLAFVDEADLCPDLGKLLLAVKPTIDAGGRMILLSKVDKNYPESEFKKIYTGGVGWATFFAPWSSRPDRDEAWYASQSADILNRTGSLDDLHENYPATVAEALTPRAFSKRLAPAWLQQAFHQLSGLTVLPPEAPSLPGLVVYELPKAGAKYAIGGDPAEGNPTSDDSATDVIDVGSGKQVATIAGRFQPSVFGSYIAQLSSWYSRAAAMIERNNHGHAVLMWLEANAKHVKILNGEDGKPGWLSSQLGKVLLYDMAADALRNNEVWIHNLTTFSQLASIDGSTLRAPEGQHDDRADAFALACVARKKLLRVGSTQWAETSTPKPVAQRW